jgi:hypothetical protein
MRWRIGIEVPETDGRLPAEFAPGIDSVQFYGQENSGVPEC